MTLLFYGDLSCPILGWLKYKVSNQLSGVSGNVLVYSPSDGSWYWVKPAVANKYLMVQDWVSTGLS